MPTTLHD
ncbi:hypothetical protein YPPY71_1835, partial [Yersinia pestis PY-71]